MSIRGIRYTRRTSKIDDAASQPALRAVISLSRSLILSKDRNQPRDRNKPRDRNDAATVNNV